MVKTKSKKRSFTLQFKLYVIRELEKTNNLSATARKFKICRAVIRRLIKAKNSLTNTKSQSEP